MCHNSRTTIILIKKKKNGSVQSIIGRGWECSIENWKQRHAGTCINEHSQSFTSLICI